MVAMVSACPICNLSDGFHDREVHDKVQVDPKLTWRSGQVPVYLRKGATLRVVP